MHILDGLLTAHSRSLSAHLSTGVCTPGLVTALALAMMTDRALLVRDFSPEGFFGSFAPAFDCEGTVERIETVAGIPGCRHVRMVHSTVPCLAAN